MPETSSENDSGFLGTVKQVVQTGTGVFQEVLGGGKPSSDPPTDPQPASGVDAADIDPLRKLQQAMDDEQAKGETE